ncbi:hypothetical protein ABZ143_002831 [Listeria monocytogenes]
MSITALMNRVDILTDDNYMWHGETLSDNYGASEEIMNEFWNEVVKRIDETYMKDYEAYHITHEESCEKNATYIGLCGFSLDRDTIDTAILELEVTNVEEWLETTVEKLEEVTKRVKADMDKIQDEIVAKYNLTYTEIDY